MAIELVRKSEDDLIARGTWINEIGLAFLALELAIRLAIQRLDEHHRINARLYRQSTDVLSRIGWYFFMVACVYVIDLMMFGQVSLFLAGLLGSLFAAKAAEFGIPAVFIAIEMYFSAQITEAEAERTEFDSPWKVWAWRAGGIILALVMPLVTLAMATAARALDAGGSMLVLLALGILSTAGHIAILFSGKKALLAKSWVFYVAIDAWLQIDPPYLQHQLSGVHQKLERAFIPYAHRWKRHNETFGPFPNGPFPPGPFNRQVEVLLQRLFGFSVGSRTAATSRTTKD